MNYLKKTTSSFKYFNEIHCMPYTALPPFFSQYKLHQLNYKYYIYLTMFLYRFSSEISSLRRLGVIRLVRNFSLISSATSLRATVSLLRHSHKPDQVILVFVSEQLLSIALKQRSQLLRLVILMPSSVLGSTSRAIPKLYHSFLAGHNSS